MAQDPFCAWPAYLARSLTAKADPDRMFALSRFRRLVPCTRTKLGRSFRARLWAPVDQARAGTVPSLFSCANATPFDRARGNCRYERWLRPSLEATHRSLTLLCVLRLVHSPSPRREFVTGAFRRASAQLRESGGPLPRGSFGTRSPARTEAWSRKEPFDDWHFSHSVIPSSV